MATSSPSSSRSVPTRTAASHNDTRARGTSTEQREERHPGRPQGEVAGRERRRQLATQPASSLPQRRHDTTYPATRSAIPAAGRIRSVAAGYRGGGERSRGTQGDRRRLVRLGRAAHGAADRHGTAGRRRRRARGAPDRGRQVGHLPGGGAAGGRPGAGGVAADRAAARPARRARRGRRPGRGGRQLRPARRPDRRRLGRRTDRPGPLPVPVPRAAGPRRRDRAARSRPGSGCSWSTRPTASRSGGTTSGPTTCAWAT